MGNQTWKLYQNLNNVTKTWKIVIKPETCNQNLKHVPNPENCNQLKPYQNPNQIQTQTYAENQYESQNWRSKAK